MVLLASYGTDQGGNVKWSDLPDSLKEIAIRVSKKQGISNKLYDITASQLRGIKDPLDFCAAAAHEANRQYCIATGDDTQPVWKKAPDWQKSSAINGVVGVLSGNTPEKSHESWMKEKLENGWKYGEVKDPEKKEHPCIVEFSELPEFQRIKDVVFCNTVREVFFELTGTKPWEH